MTNKIILLTVTVVKIIKSDNVGVVIIEKKEE